MSAMMVEALAAAHQLDAGIAVSRHDLGANLRAAAGADGVPRPDLERKIAADTFSANRGTGHAGRYRLDVIPISVVDGVAAEG